MNHFPHSEDGDVIRLGDMAATSVNRLKSVGQNCGRFL